MDAVFVRHPQVEAYSRSVGQHQAVAEYECGSGRLISLFMHPEENDEASMIKRGIFSLLQNGPVPINGTAPDASQIERSTSGVYTATYFSSDYTTRKLITHRDFLRQGAQGTPHDDSSIIPEGAGMLDPHGGAPRSSSTQEAHWSHIDGCENQLLPHRVRHTTLLSIPGAGIGSADARGHARGEAAGSHSRNDPFFDESAAKDQSTKRPSMYWPFPEQSHHERLVRIDMRRIGVPVLLTGNGCAKDASSAEAVGTNVQFKQGMERGRSDASAPDYILYRESRAALDTSATSGSLPHHRSGHRARLLADGDEAQALIQVPIVSDGARHIERAEKEGRLYTQPLNEDDIGEYASSGTKYAGTKTTPPAKAHGRGSVATWHPHEGMDFGIDDAEFEYYKNSKGETTEASTVAPQSSNTRSSAQELSNDPCAPQRVAAHVFDLLRALPSVYHNDSMAAPHIHKYGLSKDDDADHANPDPDADQSLGRE